MGRNIALQGELVGEGIQSNRLKFRVQPVFFIDAVDINKYEYLDFDTFYNLMKEMGLLIVPIFHTDY